MSDEHIEQVVRAAFLNQCVFAKVQFDNYKDTAQLHEAVNENVRMVVETLRYKVRDHKEEVIQEWIESFSEDTVGGKE